MKHLLPKDKVPNVHTENEGPTQSSQMPAQTRAQDNPQVASFMETHSCTRDKAEGLMPNVKQTPSGQRAPEKHCL